MVWPGFRGVRNDHDDLTVAGPTGGGVAVRHGELVGLCGVAPAEPAAGADLLADLDHRGECGCGVDVLGDHIAVSGQAERAALAGSITANPAFLAMLGPIGSTTVGGLTAWRIGVLAATMIGLMAIFTVIGRTRADEETGRTELLMAGVVGRSAQLVAAVIIAAGAALLIGLLVAVAGIAQGAPVTGSVALGAAFAGCGWVFAGVAAASPRN